MAWFGEQTHRDGVGAGGFSATYMFVFSILDLVAQIYLFCPYFLFTTFLHAHGGPDKLHSFKLCDTGDF